MRFSAEIRSFSDLLGKNFDFPTKEAFIDAVSKIDSKVAKEIGFMSDGSVYLSFGDAFPIAKIDEMGHIRPYSVPEYKFAQPNTSTEKSDATKISELLTKLRTNNAAESAPKYELDPNRDESLVRAFVAQIDSRLSVKRGTEMFYRGSGSTVPLDIMMDGTKITTIFVASGLSMSGELPPRVIYPVTKEKVQKEILTGLTFKG